MNKLAWKIRDTPGLRYLARAFVRCRFALMSSLLPSVLASIRWLWASRETTNFTYDLEAANERFLAANIAFVTGKTIAEIESLFRELDEDAEIRSAYKSALTGSSQGFIADSKMRVARRKAWYALARVLKPRLVVEAGVDKGLGSLVLCAALRRNTAQGYPGRYLGTDLKPGAGWMLVDDYRAYGEILYGDSIESLRTLPGPIDMFIADSCHDPDYERNEYLAVYAKLGERFVVISDQGTTALLEVAQQNDWHFFAFRERATDTIAEGTDFGVAFPKNVWGCGGK